MKYQDRNRRLVRFLQQHRFLKSDSIVLDFGAGVGHIAKAIREIAGTKAITCIEADLESQTALKKDGFHVVERLEECGSDFDAVLMVEVIEHIDSPVALLRTIKAHMRPGGRIFLSTPCGETRSGSRATNAFDTPEHVHFFTERSLTLAIEEAGFKNLDFLRVPEIYPRERGGIAFLTAYIKQYARALRDRFRGYSHLIGFVS
jgi:SAM-dependent methyltransferase